MLYAIVDIETTGGHASANGITEIAIAIHDGTKLLHIYETLINPQVPIPYFIQRLTGINDEMVAGVPVFAEVAAQIHELLHDKIFVAHNVNFDYSFIKLHLEKAGYDCNVKKLCTVRMARKIFPGMKSYSLGKLCHQLSIPHYHRHRAGGDALATSALFTMLVANDGNGEIAKMLKGRNKEQYLPPHLPVQQVDELPHTPGVYYFYNQIGKVIYIGKAKNLFKRVKTHFSNNKAGKQKQDFLREINRIGYKECATELMAHILESTEIRKLFPKYNRSQRGYLANFGLYPYEDREGYLRLTIEKNKSIHKPVYSFNTIQEGHQRLKELMDEFELCPRLCNLISSIDCKEHMDSGFCKGNCAEEAEAYNARVTEALQWLEKRLPTFALIDKGFNEEDKSCILMRKGNIYGMGYIHAQTILQSAELLEKQLEPLQDNDFIRNLVYRYAETFPDKCHVFD